MKMILNRWNYEEHRYNKVNLPNFWNCKIYCKDLNEIVNCPHCGNEIKFGDSYTSLEFHTEVLGMGYAVCERCYKEEWKRRKNNNG